MPIKPFSFAVPETRFLHSAKYVYKFKIRYGVCFSLQHIENKRQALQELVESIKAIIANHDNLYPFSTRHFLIFPYKSKWESARCLRFKFKHKSLCPFPYVFTVYIEPYSILHEHCPGQIKEQKCEQADEDVVGHETCDNADNRACQTASCSDHPAKIPCSHTENSGSGSGFLQYLISFTPFRFLFRKSHFM
ncbi:membrane-anchored junction protein [Rana temporaria]|uniref:membrane-anchored junction protein n=1 Tax=Rana temporaria TaxID=8407 RepID=UPI001AAC9170|nr:membrane-anchored junction protein [Rana temporaria]